MSTDVRDTAAHSATRRTSGSATSTAASTTPPAARSSAPSEPPRPASVGAARRSHRIQRGIALASDTVVVVLAATAAGLLRNRVDWFAQDLAFTAVVTTVTPFIVLGWLAMIAMWGAYSTRYMGVGTVEYGRVLSATGATAGLLGIVFYLAKYNFSRGFFLLIFGIGAPLLLLGRYVARRLVHRAHRDGRWRTRVIVAGVHPHIDDVAAVLSREAWLGYEVVGALTPRAASGVHTTPEGLGILGPTDSVVDAVVESRADAVVFTEGAFPSSADFRKMAWELEASHVQMIVAPGVNEVSSQRLAVRPVGGLPLVYVESPQSANASRRLKRVFDIVGASVALVLASGVMLVTALAVRRHDGGPILFRQVRVGRDGRPFSCLKFRSMVPDAEALMPTVSHLDRGNGVLFKADDDPRITPAGRWMRRYSVDELPQLLNVLRGEMSLVGPRPPLPSEVSRYGSVDLRRLQVKPGMTGLWQVSGRSDLPWTDAVRLDLYYVDNWSILQDIQILGRTVRAVIGGRGAY